MALNVLRMHNRLKRTDSPSNFSPSMNVCADRADVFIEELPHVCF
jgi:hypothetical protein